MRRSGFAGAGKAVWAGVRWIWISRAEAQDLCGVVVRQVQFVEEPTVSMCVSRAVVRARRVHA